MTLRLSTDWIGFIATMSFPAAARGDAKILIFAFHGSLDAKPRSQATIATSLTKSLALALMITSLAIGAPTIATAQTVSFQGLGVLPGGSGSWATGVSGNGNGTVAVGYGDATGSPQEAFSWKGGTITGLGFLPGYTQSHASGVNSDGTVIVGTTEQQPGYASVPVI
jgi:uncharacterized membrane protein